MQLYDVGRVVPPTQARKAQRSPGLRGEGRIAPGVFLRDTRALVFYCSGWHGI